MSQPPADKPRSLPRAIAYGRGNQATGRYRSTGPRPAAPNDADPPQPTPPAGNRRRFWLLALLLLVTLGLGAATWGTVFAGSVPTALHPAAPPPRPIAPPADTTAPRPPAEPPTRTSGGGRPERTTGADEPGPASTESGPASTDTSRGGAARPGSPTGRPAVPAESGQAGAVHYKNCGQARKAGAAPLRIGDPGYSPALDRDGDGVACEEGKD